MGLIGTTEDFRRLIAIEAQRHGRRAIAMHRELEQGSEHGAFDRFAVAAATRRASVYAWAVVSAIEWVRREQGDRLADSFADMLNDVLMNGEPFDPSLIQVAGLDD